MEIVLFFISVLRDDGLIECVSVSNIRIKKKIYKKLIIQRKLFEKRKL